MIKKFSAYVEEQAPAQDYVPSKSEGPAKGEKDFVNQHTATKTDYVVQGQDHVFNGDIKEDRQLDELSPELAKRAFDARAKKHKAAMGSASGWDKRADKDAAKGDTRGASAARSIAKDKEREAGDMEKKMDRSAKKAGVDAQDRYNKATDDRSPNQKYTDYKKKGGRMSFQDYKKRFLKQDFDVEGDVEITEGKFGMHSKTS